MKKNIKDFKTQIIGYDHGNSNKDKTFVAGTSEYPKLKYEHGESVWINGHGIIEETKAKIIKTKTKKG
jgi:hypothetical protein